MALIGEARALLINGDTGVHTKTQFTSEELAALPRLVRASCLSKPRQPFDQPTHGRAELEALSRAMNVLNFTRH